MQTGLAECQTRFNFIKRNGENMKNWLQEWENEKDERDERLYEEHSIDVTKRGVFKDLELSPFEVVFKDKKFKFSSRAKMNKFSDEMKRKETQLLRSFQRIYGENFDKETTNFDGLVRSLYITHYNQMKLK